MESFFPAQTLSLFQVFAPCFRAPSFAYFQSYLWALMVVEGRTCMSRLARCAFFHPRDLSSWERFLAEHRWSLTAVVERLGRLVVARLGEQLSYAEKKGFRLALIAGSTEISQDQVQVKNLAAKTSVTIPSRQLVATVKEMLMNPAGPRGD